MGTAYLMFSCFTTKNKNQKTLASLKAVVFEIEFFFPKNSLWLLISYIKFQDRSDVYFLYLIK